MTDLDIFCYRPRAKGIIKKYQNYVFRGVLECVFTFGQEIFFELPFAGKLQVRGDFNGPAPSVAAGDARAKEAHSATYMTVTAITSAIMAVTAGAFLFLPSYLIYPSITCSGVSGYIINI
jgi:hypothetical protein